MFKGKEQTKSEKILFLNNTNVVDSLPPDFPLIRIDTSNNPAPGSLFLTTFSLNPEASNYIMVLDSLAKPQYYHKVAMGGIDFKMQPNGLFSYASAIAAGDIHKIGPLTVNNAKVIDYVLDSKYNIIDSVQCKNGYLADTHEFRILPNGNYLMLSYEDVSVDMSKIVVGGNPNAHIIGSVIQELDAKKNCVFQWRSLDYLPITDTRDNLLNPTFEHVHANALNIDTDGNLLASFATTCEIVKIDMTSGDILWRFGGMKSDFEISGDNDDFYKPLYFTLQHDVKRLPNGNILFFDDGLRKSPQYSRAVEYSLDEKTKKANLVWEFRRNPDISGFAMGSAQRLSNGNTLIDWGMVIFGEFRTVTEVTPDKKIVYELSLPGDMYSYRGLKYQLPACQPVANVMVSESIQGNTYKFSDKKSNTGVEMYFKVLSAFMYNYITLKKYDCSPINPIFAGEPPVLIPSRYTLNTKVVYSFNSEMRFDLAQLPKFYNYDNMKVFFRKTEGKGMFQELPTTYDANSNKLVAMASDSGEYVLGFNRMIEKINPPKLISPFNNALLLNRNKVNLNWTPTGRYDSLKLEISSDSSFKNIIQSIANLKETNLQLMLDTNKTYYWRTQTYYKNLVSNWSEIWHFSIENPFMAIEYPRGKDTLYNDSTYIIRWITNLKDSLAITLYKGNNKNLLIKDTLYSETNAFDWKVPKNQIEGDNYSIRIENLIPKTNIAQTQDFYIKNRISDVINNEIKENTISIYNNPNNGFAKMQLVNKFSGNVKIKVVDLFGNIQSSVIDKYLAEGTYNIDLNLNNLYLGVYFCIVSTEKSTVSEKIIIIK
jgi:hypothetical protein